MSKLKVNQEFGNVANIDLVPENSTEFGRDLFSLILMLFLNVIIVVPVSWLFHNLLVTTYYMVIHVLTIC